MAEISNDEVAIILLGISSACNFEAASLLLEAKKAKKSRSCWVKPWRESRDSGGNIQFLLKEYNLFFDEESYTSFLRMDQRCFSLILNYVKSDAFRSYVAFTRTSNRPASRQYVLSANIFENTCSSTCSATASMRKCIPVEEKLAATLRFLATGETFKEIAENSKLSAAYLSPAVIEVCSVIYSNMKDEFLKFPDSKENWLQVANEFDKRWQFPLCLGALDGKHIAFQPKKKSANLFYNYKGFTSIVLLALADANCKFLFVDVGCNGRISDGGVLDRSDLMHVLDNDDNFPEPKVIGNNRKLPYVIVADNAFPNGKRILTPYSKQSLSRDEIVYNSRLSRARQNIERAFGILANRFRVLQTKILHDEVDTTIIVKACCLLHNFLLHYSQSYMDNEVLIDPDTDTGSQNTASTTNQNRKCENIRSEFTKYFNNEGNL